MEYLTKHKCVPCEKGCPVATTDEINAYKPQVPEWDIVDIQGSRTLRRVFGFKRSPPPSGGG